MDWKKIAIPIFIVIFLIGCAPSHQETIEIGGVFHLTGPGSFWGEGEKNGAILAIEEINFAGGVHGEQLEMIIEDGKTDFPETVNALKKLINIDGVTVIVGPTWFGQVASPIAEETKTLIISPSAGVIPEPSSYFFDVWPTPYQEIAAQVDYMKQEGVNDVVLIYHLNDWSQTMKDEFVEKATQKGMTIVKEYPLRNDEKDFKTIITQIKELDIDAIYAPFAWYPSQGEFSKQKKELGLNIPLYSSSGTDNQHLLDAYPSIEGTVYAYPAKGPGEEEFTQKYLARFDALPSPPAAYAYDAIYLLAGAFNEGKESPEDIAAYLKGLKDYPGISNTLTFNEHGRITQKTHIIKAVKNGEFAALEE